MCIKCVYLCVYTMQKVGVVALKEIPQYFHQEELFSFTLNVFLFLFFFLFVGGVIYAA